MASLQNRPLRQTCFLLVLLTLTSAVLRCQAQFGPNGTFSGAGTTKTYPVAGPFGERFSTSSTNCDFRILVCVWSARVLKVVQ